MINCKHCNKQATGKVIVENMDKSSDSPPGRMVRAGEIDSENTLRTFGTDSKKEYVHTVVPSYFDIYHTECFALIDARDSFFCANCTKELEDKERFILLDVSEGGLGAAYAEIDKTRVTLIRPSDGPIEFALPFDTLTISNLGYTYLHKECCPFDLP